MIYVDFTLIIRSRLMNADKQQPAHEIHTYVYTVEKKVNVRTTTVFVALQSSPMVRR